MAQDGRRKKVKHFDRAQFTKQKSGQIFQHKTKTKKKDEQKGAEHRKECHGALAAPCR